jgi:hypothetical protein
MIGQLRMLLTKYFQRIQTIHVGEVVVQQYQIQIRVGLCGRKSLRAGAGL